MSRLRSVLAALGRGIRDGVRSVVKLPGRLLAGAARSPRRAATVLGSVAAVLALLTATFAVLAVRNSGIETARTAAVAAAEQKVPALLSYDHRTVAKEQEAKTALLTGRFHDDYAGLLREVVVPAAEQGKLTTSTTVVTSSVVRTEGTDSVTLLMFLNQTSSSPERPEPALSGSRLRVTMQDETGDWKVSELTPV